jgi:hypothetical protein
MSSPLTKNLLLFQSDKTPLVLGPALAKLGGFLIGIYVHHAISSQLFEPIFSFFGRTSSTRLPDEPSFSTSWLYVKLMKAEAPNRFRRLYQSRRRRSEIRHGIHQKVIVHRRDRGEFLFPVTPDSDPRSRISPQMTQMNDPKVLGARSLRFQRTLWRIFLSRLH